MRTTIDFTYQSVIARLPPDLHAPARGLLFELGLARTPDAGWADVFQLQPSSELPLFALSTGDLEDEDTLASFRRAHHAACFYNVLVDRMADHQAPATPERQRLARHFLEYWRLSLARAQGKERHAARVIERAIRAWRRGIGLERMALARGSLDGEHYGRIILLKLGWAGLASECLLRQRVEPPRHPLFRSAFFLLASGMQCVDDAADALEDKALHGSGIPQALGFPPNALFTAGALLTRAAASTAARGRFDRFAQWLSHRASELERIRERRVRPVDNLAGMVIASSLEAVCLAVSRSTHNSTGGITSCVSSM
ncbi:hypothetical protein [Archangium primigenium]|uniref:hypothetical protein n=1 Tax=[Archangium] primigenium TaxID=2792470 RepID=UPI00195E056A|nr:hypothetical protein [Archangium primigenium]MBM7115695.1 hypothetical protein [Archangium primigenium]